MFLSEFELQIISRLTQEYLVFYISITASLGRNILIHVSIRFYVTLEKGYLFFFKVA